MIHYWFAKSKPKLKIQQTTCAEFWRKFRRSIFDVCAKADYARSNYNNTSKTRIRITYSAVPLKNQLFSPFSPIKGVFT